MTATALAAPRPVDVTGIHTRPGMGRLVTVELRKMVDTRAGFWMQVATIALAIGVVIGRLATGTDADHTFGSLLEFALKPAAVLLPIAGVLLVTSEWSQRTGMITFTLVPDRARLIGAKLLAAFTLSFGMLLVCFGIAAAGLVAAGTGDASEAWTLLAQCIPYICGGMIMGVAFGALLQNSTVAIVALFTIPAAWLGLASLSFFGNAGDWTDTGRSLAPLSREVVDATQWAQAGTSLAIWLLIPLLIGIWRVTKREVVA
jgi:ABC-type transport system involved in multi-copper enzyme maturation permease subunit